MILEALVAKFTVIHTVVRRQNTHVRGTY